MSKASKTLAKEPPPGMAADYTPTPVLALGALLPQPATTSTAPLLRSASLPLTPGAQPQGERLIVRLDAPVEGVELPVISLLRQADGAPSTSNRRFEYTWLRSKSKRTCAEPTCGNQREAAVMQDLVTGQRFCSRACMLRGFHEAHGKLSPEEQRAASARRRFTKAEASQHQIDYDVSDHQVWDARPFVEEDEWVEIGKHETYTPSSNDLGHVLKCVVSAFGPDASAGPTCSMTSEETTVVISPRVLPVRRLIRPAYAPEPSTSGGGFQFRVLTYNILADIYATSQAFPYCPKFALSWKYRRMQLMRELNAYDADVICLQEVQQNHYHQYLLPLLENMGYDSLYKAKTRDAQQGKVDGCAILFRRNKFTLCQNSYFEIEFNKVAHQMAQQGAFSSQPNARNSNNSNNGIPNDAGTQACLKRLCKDNVAHVVILQGVSPHTGETHQICIANTHIFWDPEYPDVKLWQTHLLLQELEGIIGHRMLPLVLCGDFNSKPDSAVVELLAQERVHPDHPDIRFDQVGILPNPPTILTHTLGLMSAVSQVSGGEPPLTNFTMQFQGVLDYIWVTESLLPVGMLEMPSEQALRSVEDAYMPNAVFPSDHIAICVDLRLGGLGGGDASHVHGTGGGAGGGGVGNSLASQHDNNDYY